MTKLSTHLLAGVAISLLSSMPAYARQLTPEEAIRLIPTEFADPATRSASQLLYTQEVGGLNAAYVVSNGNGFLVLAADDMLPAVLGYSDSGSFDAASIPPAMKAWLADYGRQLEFAVKNGLAPVAQTRTDEDFAPIAPICKTIWNQSAPFNDNSPVIDGEHAPSGCTATAMAQVMYAHKWPLKGTGTNTFVSATTQEKLTFDYGATTFDWDNMLLSYNDTYTEVQGKAVATLLEACGNSALMDFNLSGSGAYPYNGIYGMVNFMDYDKSALLVKRDFYPKAEWEALMYGELAEGRPIIYGGYDSAYTTGHTFVVDGYAENGYFHLNWGWGGSSDGYFLLMALDPSDQGIGGGSATGYSFDQDALIYVMPAQKDSKYGIEVMMEGNFSTAASSYTSNEWIEFNVSGGSGYYAYTLETVKPEMGVMLTPSEGGTSVFYPGGEVEFKSYYGEFAGGYKNYFLAASSLPKSGEYTVTPAVRLNGKIKPVSVRVGYSKTLVATCTSMGVKFASVEVKRDLTADEVVVGGKLYSGKTCRVSADIHNTGEEYLGLVKAGLADADGKVVSWLPAIPVDLTDGESVSLTFSGKLTVYEEDAEDESPLPAGEYLLSIYDNQNKVISGEPLSVKVLKVPAGTPEFITTMKVISEVGGQGTQASPYLIGDKVDVEVKVSVSQGLLDETIAIYAYYPGIVIDGYYKNAIFSSGTRNANDFLLGPGESQTFVYTLGTADFLLDNTAYIQAYGYDSGWIKGQIFLKRVSDAVDDIEAEEDAAVEYFNLQGQRVKNPSGGIFIRKQGNRTTKVLLP